MGSDRFLDGFYLLLFALEQSPFDIASTLEATGKFDVLEFDAYGKRAGTPYDPSFSQQWNLDQTKLRMSSTWDITTGSSSVILGIIDSGVRYTHEDLDGNIWVNPAEDRNGNGRPDFHPYSQGGDEDNIDNDNNGKIDDLIGWDYFRPGPEPSEDKNPDDTDGHGTNVSGIAVAEKNNSIGIAGVAGGWGSKKGVSLMVLRDGDGYEVVASLTAQAIRYAANEGARVINISSWWSDDPTVLRPAINFAADTCGIVVVACAGNTGDTSIAYPAKYSNTIAVGGTMQNDYRIGYSSFGPEMDVVAPTEVLTTYLSGYGNFGGTSASSPHVAGLAALILSINSNLTWQQVRDIIRQSADKVPGMGGQNFTNEYGYGRINAYEAILLALSYNEYDLSGTVNYYNGAPSPVNDAIFSLIHVGGKSYDTTDANGYYCFQAISGGSVSLGSSKSGDLRDAITGSDALLLLRYLAFLATLTEDQKFAADVTEDGIVSGSDAQAILAYLAFLPSHASTGEWRFDPSDTSFILHEQAIADFKAFLLGDVTGDWGTVSKADSVGVLAELELTIEAPEKDQDGFIEIPVKISNVKEPLYTLLLSISHDPKYIAFQATQQTELTEKFMVVSNGTDPCIVHLAMAGINGVNKDGEIVRLIFKGELADLAENNLALKLTRAIINDYDIIKDDGENISLPKRQAEQQLTLMSHHFSLAQNYPNPFNPTTTISYQLPAGKDQYFVTLKIYDALGRLVKVLVEGQQAPGIHQIIWDGTDVNGRTVVSGIYFYTIQAGNFRETKKMMLMR